MEQLFKYNLGDEVKDAISGFQGIVTARIDYITGCARYIVQPQTLGKEGEPHKSSTFDENTLELVQAGKVQIGNARKASGEAGVVWGFQLTESEIQSGSTRVDIAEGLIEQLPMGHEGAATWLLNYGVRERAVNLRDQHGMYLDSNTRAAKATTTLQTTSKVGGPIDGPEPKAGPE